MTDHRPHQADIDDEYDEWVDDSDDWTESSATLEVGLPLDQLLDRLSRDATLPATAEMAALSDLSRQDAEEVRQRWPMIPSPHRRALIAQLAAEAVDDLNWQLGRLLRIALDDEDPDTRTLAINGLWEDDSPDLVGVFVRLLRTDPVEQVRAAAAGALGSFMLAAELDELDATLAMRIEQSLLAVLHDETQPLAVRCQALESIAYSGEAGVRQLIDDGYYSPYEEMRLSALVAIGRSADVHWRNHARAELQNPSAAMRAQAATACGQLEAESARAELIELLTDDDPSVRLASITALGQIGGGEARIALEMMRESDNPEEVEAADVALEEIMFFAGRDLEESALLDESSEDAEQWDEDQWDRRHGADDPDLGAYE